MIPPKHIDIALKCLIIVPSRGSFFKSLGYGGTLNSRVPNDSAITSNYEITWLNWSQFAVETHEKHYNRESCKSQDIFIIACITRWNGYVINLIF